MVFSDLSFIYLFLPIFFVIYYSIKSIKYKNLFIIISSIVFYILGTLNKPFYILFLFISVIITYYSGIFIEKFPRYKKFLISVPIIYDFGILFLFKYEGFFAQILNSIFKTNISIVNLILPIGISFYTFEAVSYVIDVYKGSIKSEKNFLNFATYLCMFPQVSSGPITLYSNINSEINERTIKYIDFSEGLKLFVCGLGYKVILANNIGNLWRDGIKIGFDSISTPFAWLCAIAYSFQLYFDFYGYSLMAKGLGRMMGFSIPDNFNNPYISKSFTEFWRRWHITLSNWFKKYIYFPLGGSTKGKFKTFINLFLVWIFTSLWHGADYNYLIWGMIVLAFIVIEKAGLKKFNDSHRIIGHVYMFCLIPITWSVFAINNINQLKSFILKLFFMGGKAIACLNIEDFTNHYLMLFIVAILLSTPLDKKIYKIIKNNFIGSLVFGGIFALSLYLLCIRQNDPFIYFRF